MPATPIHWKLDIITHAKRMTAAAMHQLGDANEASWLVHRIMHRAMTNMRAPAKVHDLDSALRAALRIYAAEAA
jgi:hypothetical protein